MCLSLHLFFIFPTPFDNCVCFISVSSISLLACPRQFTSHLVSLSLFFRLFVSIYGCIVILVEHLLAFSLSQAIPRLVLRSLPISQMLFTCCQSGAEEGRTGNAASSDQVWNHSVLPLVTSRGAGAFVHMTKEEERLRAEREFAEACSSKSSQEQHAEVNQTIKESGR